MSHQRNPRDLVIHHLACALLLANAPRSVTSFTFHSKPTGACRNQLTAYTDPDGWYSGRYSTDNTFRDYKESILSSIGADIDEDEFDTVGAGTLGDIMTGTQNNANTNSSQTAIIDGLVTKEGGELNAKFGCRFSPMERIALTANGNLQRIFSSYYDAPIHVHVDSCTRRYKQHPSDITENMSLGNYSFNIEANGAVWDRVVHLHVYEQTLCKATSVIYVRSPECVELIEKGTVGLGQLFRYLNKLPTFKLLDAGRTDLSEALNGYSKQSAFHGGIWRTYELQCEEMTCLIHEEFHRDAWDISEDSVPYEPTL